MNFDAIECWAGRPFLVSAISTHHHIRLRRGFQSPCSLASISLPFDDPLSEKGVRGIIHVTSTDLSVFLTLIQPILPCFLILSSLGYPSPNPMQTSRVNGPRDNAPSLFDRTKSPFPSTNRFSAVRSFVPLLRLRSESRRMELGCRCRLWQRLQRRGCIAPRAKAFHTPMHAIRLTLIFMR